jgi:hypothetical protein
MSASVRQRLAIVLIIAGYFGVAAAQDGPIQVWLLILAPFVLIAVALVLHITDLSKNN